MSFKKTFLSIGLITFLLAGCADSLNRKNPETIIDIQKHLKKINYTNDDKNYKWQSAKETERRGKGDCEDIATNGALYVELIGYKPKLLFLISEIANKNLGGHAVTLLEKEENKKVRYGAIDFLRAYPPVYESIDQLVFEISFSMKRIYTHYSVMDLDSLGDWRTTNRDLKELVEPYITYNKVDAKKIKF